MKKILGLVAAMLLGMGVSVARAAPQWMVLNTAEMAKWGATHCLEIEYNDAGSVATNTAVAFTNSVAANTAVEFVALILDTAWSGGNTNYTQSAALKIGDGSDDDLFLTSTELASDGTEVFVKYGPPHSETITSTPTKQSATFATNVVLQTATITYINPEVTTNTAVVVTNVTLQTAAALTNLTISSSASAGELSRKLYTAAGSIVSTLTPNAEDGMDDFTAGKVRLYFKLFTFGD